RWPSGEGGRPARRADGETPGEQAKAVGRRSWRSAATAGMVASVTATPHDALFKAAFSKPRHARGLLRALVPGPLGRRIAWATLRLESGIAVGDEDLDEQRMDLVYSARAGRRRVLIYVLAEHQSKVDPWMAFRLLSYLVAIWKGYRAQHPRAKKLPAILPV